MLSNAAAAFVPSVSFPLSPESIRARSSGTIPQSCMNERSIISFIPGLFPDRAPSMSKQFISSL